MPANRKNPLEIVGRSRAQKTVTGLLETEMPFDRDTFDTDMEYILAKDAYESLQVRGINFKDVTPQILMYAKCLAKAFQILDSVGEDYAIPTERSGKKRNPLVNIAMDFMDKARQYSAMLGIDPKTRGNMPVTIPKLPSEKPENKASKFLDKL